jgi:subtilisin family serine protease
MSSVLFFSLLLMAMSEVAQAAPVTYSDADFRPGEVILKLPDTLTIPPKIEAVMARLGLRIKDRYPQRQLLLVAGRPDMPMARLLGAFRDSGVLYAEPNFQVFTEKTPNDPLYPLQHGLVQIDAPAVWDYSTGARTIIVAVPDTPVDWRHPDLIDNLWVNTLEDLNHNGQLDESDKNGIDDDGNGDIDDVIGYQFVDNDPDVSKGLRDDHGTHVSGIIGARGNNGQGTCGVAWQVRLMLAPFVGGMAGSVMDGIKAVDYVVRNGANIINCSWRVPGFSEALLEVFKDAEKKGILVTAAAGNSMHNIEDHPVYPANYGLSNIIVVAATNNLGNLAPYSNYGPHAVHVAAPGTRYVSTVSGGGYMPLSGTSMATPVVSGSAALLLAINPRLSPPQLKQALMKTCVPSRDLADKVVCGGQINLFEAMKLVKTF